MTRRPALAAILARNTATADAHRAADEACGRPWSCQCGACRIERERLGVRGDPPKA